MKIKKVLVMLLIMTMTIGLLAACGSGSGGGSEASGREDLILAVPMEPDSLDPALTAGSTSMRMLQNIFEGLVDYNSKTGEIVPMLAESWEMGDDNATFTFHLRDAKFHNGDAVTAEDVLFSVERSEASPLGATVAGMIESAEAADEKTVVLKLAAPNAEFLPQLKNILIVSKAVVEEKGDAAFDEPIGTGAYKFVSYSTSDRFVMTRNDEYWGGAPAIKDVTYRIIPNAESMLASLLAHEIDLLDFDPGALEDIEADESLTYESYLSDGSMFMAINTTQAPLDDIRVRQAINYCINKELYASLVGGTAFRPAEFLVQGSYMPDTSGLKPYDGYDLEKAKALLEEAGVTDIKLTLWGLGNDYYVTPLQQLLKEAGIDSVIQSGDVNAFTDALANPETECSLAVYSLAFGQLSQYSMMLGSGAPFNGSRAADAEIDALFASAAVEMDDAKRLDLYNQIFNKVHDEVYYIPLCYVGGYVGYNADLNVVLDGSYPVIKAMSWK